MKRKAELCTKISELESPKRWMISEMKTRPSEDNEPKSGGRSSVSGSGAGTSFGGLVDKALYGKTEIDSHANTTLAGQNCVPLWHMEILCDVALFSNMYEPMKDVAILSASTLFTSTTGRQYILVLHECLYMTELFHTFINPNQLCHFQTQVQGKTYVTDPKRVSSAQTEI